MSNEVKQETGQRMGDDRDFFEEDFHGLVPGHVIELPEGYDVTLADFPCEIDPRFTAFLTRDITGEDVQHPAGATKPQKWSMRFEEADLGNVLPRDIQIEGVDGAFDYVGYVSRKQLDDDHTKATITDLQKNGIVTIVDGKTGTSIGADAYKMATLAIDSGACFPWDYAEGVSPAVDWAHATVRGRLSALPPLVRVGVRAVSIPKQYWFAFINAALDAYSDFVGDEPDLRRLDGAEADSLEMAGLDA